MNYRSALLFVFIVLFALSGFSGLIYESIWSHYLKLFLGHSSYAQVLVLVIFMGGMAIGSALAAKVSRKFTNLILWYGIAEGVIGLFGITFHQLFLSVQTMAFDSIFPNLNSPWLVHLVKWSLGGLMILPQSILLGATFPFLATGLIRRFPNNHGKTLSTLYFVNSLGASVGILCNAFLFIPAIGLPGAVLSAGIINIILAIIVYRLSKNDHYPAQPIQSKSASGKNVPLTHGLFLVAALTGLASFMYEIGWIRMLTMVLGGSTHSFEIMLSAFILGLAIGGFWIRKKIDHFENPVLILGTIQLLMGALAALTIPLYNQTYELMGIFVEALSQNDSGYMLYAFFSYAIALIVMLPAAICAGTTLPLVTYILLGSKSGDASIGKVYAWNTVGSIIGIAIAVLIVMPVLGLKWVIVVGALIDVVLGGYLIYLAREQLLSNKFQMALASVCVLTFLSFPFTGLDTAKMASGVFRYGLVKNDDSKVIFHRDGMTSTVAIKELDGKRILLNNGKPDAGLFLAKNEGKSHKENHHTEDEPTMVLLGTLPYVYKPESKYIANIGLGSGLTAHTLLQHQGLVRLDTIEIERAVYEASGLFRPNVDKIFTDPRSNIIIDDAKTYFAASGNKYDVIVSEPPNPWVSGVAGLFSTEFYSEIRRYLTVDGVLVQWMHLYEISPELVATVYNALKANFSDIHFYQISAGDIAMVASNAQLQANYDSPFMQANLKAELATIDIESPDDIAFRKLADKRKLDVVFAALGNSSNSDFFPILDIGAAKTRFKKSNASAIYQLHQTRALDKLLGEREVEFDQITKTSSVRYSTNVSDANEFYDLLMQYINENEIPDYSDGKIENYTMQMAKVLGQCLDGANPKAIKVKSNVLVDVSLWTYDDLAESKLKHVFELAKRCETDLNDRAQLWVNAHLAWFDRNLMSVYQLTNQYLTEQKNFTTAYDQQLLVFNLTSRVATNNNQGVYEFYKKTPPGFRKDLEARSLFNLLKQSLDRESLAISQN